MFLKRNVLAPFVLAALLPACSTTGMFPRPGEAYIKDVTVSASPTAPGEFSERVRAAVLADSQQFPQTGAAKRLSIAVLDYHLKNPGASLLVGDDNRAAGTVTVVDDATGVTNSRAHFVIRNSDFPQGLIGLVQAATQDANVQERVLSVQAGHAVLENFYGSELLTAYLNGRRTASPQAVAAPAPTPAIKYVPLLPTSNKATPGTS